MLTRMGAGLAALTIAVLSTVPGRMRPHILGNDYFEHFTAYFITGSLWAIGCLRPVQLLSSGVLLALCAGLLEFVQLWIPGRMASAGDFAASAIGAWIGLLIIVAVRRAHERRYIVSQIDQVGAGPQSAWRQVCDQLRGGPIEHDPGQISGRWPQLRMRSGSTHGK
jgi:VanZ family protein